ncbi:MAG: HemK family protein methyltransferase [Mycoplasmataceae bacterium]|nr:HemK family protein methyltransferase [Mycoplasmataceae bacterium]
MFFLSKKVKNLTSFVVNRKTKIDFTSAKYFSMLERYYSKNEPLGSIIKCIKFLNVQIKIKKGILVPRDETELVVLKAIQLIKKHKISSVYDLCCGTGNIGLAIKKTLPKINITSVDINHVAIANTKENAKLNNLKIETICGDFYASIKNKTECIVCNPPYVNEKELNKDMTKYENKISFTNSKNDIFFYKKILDNYKKIMKEKFLIVFEIGYNQKEKLTKVLKENNLYSYAKFYKDLAKLDRILVINKF